MVLPCNLDLSKVFYCETLLCYGIKLPRTNIINVICYSKSGKVIKMIRPVTAIGINKNHARLAQLLCYRFELNKYESLKDSRKYSTSITHIDKSDTKQEFRDANEPSSTFLQQACQLLGEGIVEQSKSQQNENMGISEQTIPQRQITKSNKKPKNYLFRKMAIPNDSELSTKAHSKLDKGNRMIDKKASSQLLFKNIIEQNSTKLPDEHNLNEIEAAKVFDKAAEFYEAKRATGRSQKSLIDWNSAMAMIKETELQFPPKYYSRYGSIIPT